MMSESEPAGPSSPPKLHAHELASYIALLETNGDWQSLCQAAVIFNLPQHLAKASILLNSDKYKSYPWAEPFAKWLAHASTERDSLRRSPFYELPTGQLPPLEKSASLAFVEMYGMLVCGFTEFPFQYKENNSGLTAAAAIDLLIRTYQSLGTYVVAHLVLLKAIITSDLGDSSEAVKFFRFALMTFEQDESTKLLFFLHIIKCKDGIGLCLSRLGRRKEALPYFHEAVALAEKGLFDGTLYNARTSISVSNNLATCLSDLNRPHEALAIYNSIAIIISLHPHYLDNLGDLIGVVYSNRSNSLFQIKEYAQAIQGYQTALFTLHDAAASLGLDLRAEIASCQYSWAKTIFVGRNLPTHAIHMLNRSLETFQTLNTANSGRFSNQVTAVEALLGHIHLSIKDIGKAKHFHERALARGVASAGEHLPSSNFLALGRLAASLLENGTIDEALMIMEDAHEEIKARSVNGQDINTIDTVAFYAALANVLKAHSNQNELLLLRSIEYFRLASSHYEQWKTFTYMVEDREAVNSLVNGIYDGIIESSISLISIRPENDSRKVAIMNIAHALEATLIRRLFDIVKKQEIRNASVPQNLVDEYNEAVAKIKEIKFAATAVIYNGICRSETDENNATAPTEIRLGHPKRSTTSESRLPETRDPSRSHQSEFTLAIDSWRDITRKIQEFDSDFNPENPASISFEGNFDLLEESEYLVYFFFVNQAFSMIVVNKNHSDYIDIPDLSESDIRDIFSDWIRICRIDVEEAGSGKAFYADYSHRIENAILTRITPLANRVFTPMLESIPDQHAKIILVLDPLLASLPVQSCILESGQSLGESHEITQVPSYSLYVHCAQNVSYLSDDIVVIDPSDDALTFAKAEAMASWPSSQATRVSAINVERQMLFEKLSRCDVFHCCGHARYDPRNPLWSELIGHENSTLRLQDCFDHLELPCCSLAILNSCETSMAYSRLLGIDSKTNKQNWGDVLADHPRFSTGFLFAGARCTISTLWTTWDISSALLIWKFCAFFHSGESKGQVSKSLRLATKWLKEEITSGPYLQSVVIPEFFTSIGEEYLKGSDMQKECHAVLNTISLQHPDSPPFASPTFWAQYVVSGHGWRCNL